MSEQSKRKIPYKHLGDQLKRLRQKSQESMAEVSGAVEIDIDTLSSIERGLERPSEEILLLLISHFSIKESDADKLWELAGYDRLGHVNTHTDPASSLKQNVIVLPTETRIIYSDMVHVGANNFGVVINFLQSSGLNNQPLAIARIGMSKEHARSVIEILQKTLDASEPKALPSPPDSTGDK
jgi:transcriptional regulator with XRE-family HTH domain